MALAVLWFRRDLRLDDLPALRAAAEAGPDGVVALVRGRPRPLEPGRSEPAALPDCRPGRPRHRARGRLGGALGRPDPHRPAVAAAVGATVVTATADFGPFGTARDAAVARALSAGGCRLVTVDSNYAVSPGRVRTKAGTPFKVFTAYKRAWESNGWPRPSPVPAVRYRCLPGETVANDLGSELAAPGSHGLPDWWEGLPLGPASALPDAGPEAAWDRLERFVAGPMADYDHDRDLPRWQGPRASRPIYASAASTRAACRPLSGQGPAPIGCGRSWPGVSSMPTSSGISPTRRARRSSDFGARLRWDTNKRARERFAAWATGTTGYPLVDAGMRQLLAEGWMHNRVRMVTASFLVKDLHIDWRLGARWFMWHLVDGDLASNQHGMAMGGRNGHRRRPVPPDTQPVAPAGPLRPDGNVRQPVPG